MLTRRILTGPVRFLLIVVMMAAGAVSGVRAYESGAYACIVKQVLSFDKIERRERRGSTLALKLKGKVLTISGPDFKTDDFVVRVNRTDYLRGVNKNGLVAMVGGDFALAYIFPTRDGIKTYTLLAACKTA